MQPSASLGLGAEELARIGLEAAVAQRLEQAEEARLAQLGEGLVGNAPLGARARRALLEQRHHRGDAFVHARDLGGTRILVDSGVHDLSFIGL